MLNNSEREEIKAWLNSKRDYDQGLLLLSKHTKNRILLKKRNIPLEKIVFELNKYVGNDIIIKPVVKQVFIVEKPKIETQKIKPQNQLEVKKKNTLIREESIVVAKYQIQELIKKIDMMHKELYDLGTSNDKETNEKRRVILEKRIPIIEKYDKLYQLKEEFFKTGIVAPELKKLIASKIENEKTITTPKITSEKEMLKLTDVELLKRKQQLSSSITKTKNVIKYQSIKKLEVENPLTGDDKKNAEKKLKDLIKEQNMIINEIKRRNG